MKITFRQLAFTTFLGLLASPVHAADFVYDVPAATTVTETFILSGNSALIKNGDGTLIIDSYNEYYDSGFGWYLPTYSNGTYVNAGTIQVGVDGLISGNIVNNAELVFMGFTGFADTVISGSGNVTMDGAYNYFWEEHSFTGSLTLRNDASINISSLADGGTASSLGAGGSAASNLVLDGAYIQYGNNGAASTDRLFTLGTGGATFESYGDGPVAFTNTGALAFTGSGARTLTLGGSVDAGENLFAAVIGDGDGGATSLTKAGDSNWTLTGLNTYTGVTRIEGFIDGTLTVDVLADGGVASGIGASGSAASNLVLNGGFLRYTGIGGSTDRGITVEDFGGGIIADGSGAIQFTNTGDLVAGGDDYPRDFVLGGESTADNVFALNIVDGEGDRRVTLYKRGEGKWILTGNNTFAGDIFGGVNIEAGTLQVGNGGTTGSLGTGDVSNDGTLIFNRSDDVTYSGYIYGSGTVVKAGAGTLTMDYVPSVNRVEILAGTLSTGSYGNSDPSELLLDGGTLQLTGADFYTDMLFTLGTNGGGIRLGGTDAVQFFNTGAIAFAGSGARVLTLGGTNTADNVFDTAITDGTGGATSLVKDGSGRWNLTRNGTNSYTGGTTLNAGNLRIRNPGILGTGTLTLNGGTFEMAEHNTGITFANDVTVAGNAAIVSDARINGGPAVTHTLSGTFTIGSHTLTVSRGSNVGSGTAGLAINTLILTGNPTFTANSNTLLTLGSITGTDRSITVNGAGNTAITGVIATGDGGLTKSGNGTLTLTGANTYTGTTTVNTGTLQIGTGATGSIAGNLANNAAVTVNRSGTLTLGGVISGAGTLAKSGTGTLILTNTGNTFTGATTVSNGVLRAAGAGTLGTSGTLTLSGGSLELAADTAATFGRNVILSSGATITSDRLTGGAGITQTLGTLAMGAQTLTVTRGSNVSSGTAGLAFGNVTLSGNATFAPGSGTQLTLASVSVSSGNRNITVNGAGNMAITGNIATGSGTLAKSGAGTLTLSGSNTYSGTTTVSAGTLRATTSAAALGAGGLTLSGGALQLANDTGLAFNRNTTVSANTTITSDRLSTGAGVTHTLGTLSIGSQTLTIAKGSSATTGTAGVSFGAATLTGNATLSADTGTQLALASVTGTNRNLAVTGEGNTTLGAVTTGTGTLTKSGGGRLTLSGTNTYSGATTVGGGTLALVSPGTNNIAFSSRIIVGDTAVLDVTGVTGAGGFAVAGGQTISGQGSIVGDLTIASGATLSPGSSPGTLSQTGDQTWLGGGNYNWQMYDAAGAAGTGYDTLTLDGGLDLTGLDIANKFNINLWSLSGIGPDANGAAINFDTGSTMSWVLVSTTGGVSGFDAALFNINLGPTNGTNGFSNDPMGGSFILSLENSGLDVVLSYQVIPEPSTWLLLFLGLGVLALRACWRRAVRT